VRESRPIARSPITPASPEVIVEGWAVSGRRSRAGLTLTDCTPAAKVVLKASAEGTIPERLGVPFGRAATQTWTLGGHDVAVIIVGSGPGEWLVLAPPGAGAGVFDRVTALAAESTGDLVSVLDLSHGRALVRLTGARSADLLAKETAVNLADAVCPNGSALRSALAGLAADIVRDDRGSARSYLVHCERSSGQYLFDSLLDAGAEFGIDVNGFVPPEI